MSGNNQAAKEELEALGCDPARVEESFVRSQGAGGQNVNKVASCVVLRYPPENIAVKMQRHRTQAANRNAAWELLVQLLRKKRREQAALARSKREQMRRQKRQRPGWLKAQLRDLKQKRARKKERRQTPSED
jgi:protein subunit release factor B